MPFSIQSPTLEDKLEFNRQGLTRKDLPDIWNLFQVANRTDDADHAETIDDLEREFDDPWSNPLTDGRVVRSLKGKLAAFARVFVNPKPTTENLAFLSCEVAPDAKAQGLEQECLDWMQERATERLAEIAEAEEASDLPRVIRTDFPESARETIRLYQANGYRQARAFFKMKRDLRDPIPEHSLPQGLTLRTYSQDIDESLRQVVNEAFSDHWGHQEVTAEEWHPFVIDASSVRRDLILIAMDGDEIAGFCINRVKQLENDRLNIQRGWIGTLGTRRKYRRQGIGSALIVESMRRFKAEGFDSVGLGVDAENLTGALGLYERLGFTVFKTRVVLEKRVG